MKITEEYPGIPDNHVCFHAMTVEYIQHTDASQLSTDDHQRLNVRTESNGATNFIVFETERWAVNEPEDIAAVLKHFENMMPKGE